MLENKHVVLYSDNKGMFVLNFVLCIYKFIVGAEHATTKGSAKCFDHNQIIHECWTIAYKHRINLWIERVASKFNISDSPSRGDHSLLHEMKAQWHPAVWAEEDE